MHSKHNAVATRYNEIHNSSESTVPKVVSEKYAQAVGRQPYGRGKCLCNVRSSVCVENECIGWMDRGDDMLSGSSDREPNILWQTLNLSVFHYHYFRSISLSVAHIYGKLYSFSSWFRFLVSAKNVPIQRMNVESHVAGGPYICRHMNF